MILRSLLLWLLLISLVAFGFMLTPGLRFLTAWNTNVLLGALTVLLCLAIGLKSEAFYATRRGRRPLLSVHHAQVLQNGVVYLLAWAGGMDPLAATGALFVGDVLFQARVNSAHGLPLVDPDEQPTYDLGQDEIPKYFYGRGRYLQVIVGILLTLRCDIALWNVIL